MCVSLRCISSRDKHTGDTIDLWNDAENVMSQWPWFVWQQQIRNKKWQENNGLLQVYHISNALISTSDALEINALEKK